MAGLPSGLDDIFNQAKGYSGLNGETFVMSTVAVIAMALSFGLAYWLGVLLPIEYHTAAAMANVIVVPAALLLTFLVLRGGVAGIKLLLRRDRLQRSAMQLSRQIEACAALDLKDQSLIDDLQKQYNQRVRQLQLIYAQLDGLHPLPEESVPEQLELKELDDQSLIVLLEQLQEEVENRLTSEP